MNLVTKKMRNILFIFLTGLVVSGCGGQKTAVKKFYMIEQPGAEAKVQQDKAFDIDAWCQVDEVDVYPAYATHRIVFRDASHQIRYFSNNQWAVRPSKALTPVIMDYLSANKVFRRVSDRFWETEHGYQLKTTIFNIEVGPNENKEYEAHLNLRFQLIDTQNNSVVVSHVANRKPVLENKSLNLLAATLSDIFYEELETFTQMIRDNLSETDKK
jgi:ABC-type uncharacterized transport system auxiliary subunit